MILLAGIPSEPPLSLAIEAATKRKIPFVVFNQRHADTYDLSLKYIDKKFSGIIQINGTDYELEKFNGIYIRMMDYHFLPEIKNKIFNYIGSGRINRSIQLHINFLKWLDAPGSRRVVNQPVNMLNNMSKPYQAQLISECGLLIPPTLITNHVELLKKFKNKNKNLVYKSISSVRSIVKDLDGIAMQNIASLKYLPTQFQKKLDGINIRVHVIGKKTFATKIKSEVTDYRYSGKEGKEVELQSIELPVKIINACLKISQLFELPFCGIDLFKTTDNKYFCFEVNPSPGYSYYQENTGQDIAGALVRYLESGI